MKPVFRFLVIIALGVAVFLPCTTFAIPIDKELDVNVYIVRESDGSDAPSTGPAGNDYFAAETNKIWAQAGIFVDFNFAGFIDNSLYTDLDLDAGEFEDLTWNYGEPGFYSNSGVDLFLVHTVVGAYGVGWLGKGGVAIAMDTVMGYNSPLGRIDTIAHELGHNLGLDHFDVAAFLMCSGGLRNPADTIGDIFPDGLGLDKLGADEISSARTSELLKDRQNPVPEPGTMVLMVMGLLAVAGVSRGRKLW